MNLQESCARMLVEFQARHGRPPRWIAAAPGRVNLIGEHTDYNDGLVLPMAIERYTVIAAAPNGSDKVALRSANGDGQAVIDLSQPLKPRPKGRWENYPIGVIAGFVARNLKPQGFDAVIASTVPLGGGLSSSAALEVATATLLEAIAGQQLDPVEKALLCQKAEHDYAGMPCGIMDQFISLMAKAGHLLLLDCRSRQTQHVPLADPSLQVLIINTNVKHELTGSEYPTRRKQCEAAAQTLGVTSLRTATMAMLDESKPRLQEVIYRRARHVIGEISRTEEAAHQIRAGRWNRVGELMYGSHDSLKNDYEVSCAELDAVVELARSIGMEGGIIGCRMTGAGFGGCAVALVKADKVDAITNTIEVGYKNRTGIAPTMFVSRPGQGAVLLKS